MSPPKNLWTCFFCAFVFLPTLFVIEISKCINMRGPWYAYSRPSSSLLYSTKKMCSLASKQKQTKWFAQFSLPSISEIFLLDFLVKHYATLEIELNFLCLRVKSVRTKTMVRIKHERFSVTFPHFHWLREHESGSKKNLELRRIIIEFIFQCNRFQAKSVEPIANTVVLLSAHK